MPPRAAGRAPSRTTSSKSSWSATPTSTRRRPRCGSSPTSSPTPRRGCRSSTRSRSPATTCRRPGPRPTSSSPTPWPTASSTCAPAWTPGLDIDAFAPRLSFFWAIGMNFFMEVAKLRAGRLLWAKLVKQFEPEERQVAVAAHPLPDLGLVADRAGRVQQRGAHLRRGDGRDPGPHPVAAHQRARRGARAARPTSPPASPATPSCSCSRSPGTCRVIDPWGGSAYVERLTYELARRAWPHIEEVEAAGGMAKAIEAGIPKLRIEEAAARTQARIDSGRQPVIGVNKYRVAGDERHRRAQGRQRGGARPADREAAPAARRTRRGGLPGARSTG